MNSRIGFGPVNSNFHFEYCSTNENTKCIIITTKKYLNKTHTCTVSV